MKKELKSFLVGFIITAAIFGFIFAISVADKNSSDILTSQTQSVFSAKREIDGTSISFLGKNIYISSSLMQNTAASAEILCCLSPLGNELNNSSLLLKANIISGTISGSYSILYRFGIFIGEKIF